MSKEMVSKLEDVENSLLKSIEGTISLNKVEKVVCLIEKIANIKYIENRIVS